MMNKNTQLHKLDYSRDVLIRRLVLKYQDISNLRKPDDFMQADSNLLDVLMSHPAIQDRLGRANDIK